MITSTVQEKVVQSGTYDASKARKLTVNAAGLAAVINTLTNMYSNPLLAVLREYSCNARDSHVAVGKHNVPIQVTLPVPLDTQLKIEDFGLGMSRDEVLSTFADYGNSTKSQSNDFIGAMGIGSKSGFAIGNQFTVTAVKDGYKTIALFVKNRNGEPTVDILFEGETEEPNGVLIEIGIENHQAIVRAAQTLFYTWDQGSVHVNGKRPAHVWAEDGMEHLGDDIHFLPTRHEVYSLSDKLTFVMGGVGYPVTEALVKELPEANQKYLQSLGGAKFRFYVAVPIGSLELSPSRESLRIHDNTINTVNRAIDRIRMNFAKRLLEKVDAAEDITSAAMVVRSIRNDLNWRDSSIMTWRGRAMGAPTQITDMEMFYLEKRGRYNSEYITRREEAAKISIDHDASNFIVVTGVPEGKINTVRRYVKSILLTDNTKNVKVLASHRNAESLGWFEYGKGGMVTTITFEDWRASGIALFKSSTSATASTSRTVYDVIGEDDMTGKEIVDMGMPVAYFNSVNYVNHSDLFVQSALKGYLVVRLRKNQKEEVFLKRVPGAKVGKDVIRAYAKKITDSVTPADLKAFESRSFMANVNGTEMSFLVNHQHQIAQKDILAMIAEYNAQRSLRSASDDRLQLLIKASHWVNDVDFTRNGVKQSQLIATKYPLVSLYLDHKHQADRNYTPSRMATELIRYINSV